MELIKEQKMKKDGMLGISLLITDTWFSEDFESEKGKQRHITPNSTVKRCANAQISSKITRLWQCTVRYPKAEKQEKSE